MIIQADEPNKLDEILRLIGELTTEDKQELWEWFNSKAIVGDMIVDLPEEKKEYCGKTQEQKDYKGICPECGGKLHEVLSSEESDNGYRETYLWCNGCDVSIDESGGYTK